MREGGAWTVCRFKKGAWRKKRGGGVFLRGGLMPQGTLCFMTNNSFVNHLLD